MRRAAAAHGLTGTAIGRMGGARAPAVYLLSARRCGRAAGLGGAGRCRVVRREEGGKRVQFIIDKWSRPARRRNEFVTLARSFSLSFGFRFSSSPRPPFVIGLQPPRAPRNMRATTALHLRSDNMQFMSARTYTSTCFIARGLPG